MAAVGGSVREMSWAGRIFAAAGDSTPGIRLGGYQNEQQANGNLTARQIKTATTWMVDGFDIEIDQDREDQEFLQAGSDSSANEVFTITLSGGYTYQGSGSIEGEIKYNTGAATATVSFSGPGRLTLQ